MKCLRTPSTRAASNDPTAAVARLALTVLAMAYPAAATQLQPSSCTLETSPKEAAVYDVWVDNSDLHVQLATDLATGADIQVDLRDRANTSLASTTIAAKPGAFTKVILPAAMLDAETRDISYFIHVSDQTATPLMPPFPFVIIFDCPESSPCSFDVIPGLETDAIIVTEELHEVLHKVPLCNLKSALPKIQLAFPSVRGAAQTLTHQLKLRGHLKEPLPINHCLHEWQAVVPKDFAILNELESAEPSAQEPRLEIAGFDRQATHCYDLQGVYPSPVASSLVPFQQSGRTGIEVSILCVGGGSGCSQACSGNVEFRFNYMGCVEAEAYSCAPEATAYAAVAQEMTLSVRGEPVLTGSVSTFAGVEQAATDLQSQREVFASQTLSSTPADVRLDVAIGLDFAASGELTNNGGVDAYAYAQSANGFRLTAVGQSACTASTALTKTIASSDLLEAVFRKSGGLKVNRWWPDEMNLGLPVPQLLPSSSAPAVCDGNPTS